MLLAAEERELLHLVIGLLEEVEPVFEAQDAAHGVVDAAHRHFALLDELFEQRAEFPVVGIHRHVDTGIYRELDRLLLILGDVVARVEVVDVGPVGYDHTVPVETLFEPYGQQLVVGVHRQTVVHRRVDHKRERSRLCHFEIGREVLLAQVLNGYRRRRAVLAADRNAVAHVVLHAGCDMAVADMVGVVALKSEHGLASHFGIEVAVLAVILPHARPARVAAEVYDGSVCPRNAARLGLVGRYAGTLARECAVERGAHVHTLREEGSAQRICRAVYLVDAVDAGYADRLHGLLLYVADDAIPCLWRLCDAGRDVEYRTDLILADYRVEHRLVELESLGVDDRHYAHVDRHHPLLRHAAREVELLLYAVFFEQTHYVLLRRASRIESGEGVGPLLEQIYRQLAHLSHLLFEGHLAQALLDLSLYFFVARDRGRGDSCGRAQQRCDGAA